MNLEHILSDHNSQVKKCPGIPPPPQKKNLSLYARIYFNLFYKVASDLKVEELRPVEPTIGAMKREEESHLATSAAVMPTVGDGELFGAELARSDAVVGRPNGRRLAEARRRRFDAGGDAAVAEERQPLLLEDFDGALQRRHPLVALVGRRRHQREAARRADDDELVLVVGLLGQLHQHALQRQLLVQLQAACRRRRRVAGVQQAVVELSNRSNKKNRVP